jgi:hypothetical protein
VALGGALVPPGIGCESVYGAAPDELLGENAEDLIAEAMAGSDVKELPF